MPFGILNIFIAIVFTPSYLRSGVIMQTSEMLNGVSIGMQNALQTPNRSDNGIISALFNDQDKKENIR